MDGYSGKRRRLTRRDFVRRCGAAVALALAPAAPACTSRGRSSAASPDPASGPVRGGTLTLRSFSDIATLDYAGGSDGYSRFVQMQCLESLLAFDSQLKLAPLLAQHWESPDAMTYVFSLRQGVRFQDGTALDAAAVRYSLVRLLQRVTGGDWSGGKNPLSIDTIEAVDSNTIRVSLASPLAPFLSALGGNSTGFWAVLSPAIAEKYGRDRLGFDLTGAGTGPFAFAEWSHGDAVTLQRNSGYWGTDQSGGPLPYLDRLVVRVIPGDTEALASLRTGEVDAFSPLPTSAPPPKDVAGIKWDPLESTCRHASLSIL